MMNILDVRDAVDYQHGHMAIQNWDTYKAVSVLGAVRFRNNKAGRYLHCIGGLVAIF
jgi:choline-glycine betaine transporter